MATLFPQTFSLRVSTLADIGLFYNTNHFELEYAKEYKTKNYKSAFLDTFCCIHIGKKTWENTGINSYNLNHTGQFVVNDEQMAIKVISDPNSTWKDFKMQAVDKLPYYVRCMVKNITGLDQYEKNIFNGNNFNYTRPVMNKIMTYIEAFKNTKSQLLVMIDATSPIVLGEGFMLGLKYVFDMKVRIYDMIVLPSKSTSDTFELTEYNDPVNIHEIKGFILSQNGIKKVLQYIEENGIKNRDDLFKCNLKIYTLGKQMLTYESDSPIIETHMKLEGYTFYSQLDSFGNDINHYGNKNILELKEICDKNPAAIGFNTLGWMKDKINSEKDFIYLPKSINTNEGLYIKNQGTAS